MTIADIQIIGFFRIENKLGKILHVYDCFSCSGDISPELYTMEIDKIKTGKNETIIILKWKGE